MRIQNKGIWGLVTIIIPLLIGGIFYYIFCPDVWFVKIVDYYTNLNLHIQYDIYKNIFVAFLRNYLLDYLWAYAFANALYLICDTDGLIVSCILSILIGAFWEMSQFIGIVNGTFDVLDIIFEILGALSAIFIIKKVKGETKNEKN